MPDEAKYVYYQPTRNTEMRYPCITYKHDRTDTKHADNVPYTRTKRYQVTVMDEDPDSELFDKVEGLPATSFDRGFESDQLHHKTYNLYF